MAPASCQHEDNRVTHLVSIKNTENGVRITVFPENRYDHRDPDSAAGSELVLSHYSLSSECGDQYFRCQDVLVENLQLPDNAEPFSIRCG